MGASGTSTTARTERGFRSRARTIGSRSSDATRMGKMIFEWAPESPAASEIEKLTKVERTITTIPHLDGGTR